MCFPDCKAYGKLNHIHQTHGIFPYLFLECVVFQINATSLQANLWRESLFEIQVIPCLKYKLFTHGNRSNYLQFYACIWSVSFKHTKREWSVQSVLLRTLESFFSNHYFLLSSWQLSEHYPLSLGTKDLFPCSRTNQKQVFIRGVVLWK